MYKYNEQNKTKNGLQLEIYSICLAPRGTENIRDPEEKRFVRRVARVISPSDYA